ncbi:hypothetical protein [Paraliobacillus ryukyuensis]|uniref:hypothetical protein n=1 Tax=Paraliobacillus ryukyuensis TaxID=200904 RepID=UPI0009A6D02D|nr:hypothetical protein [Paraliobacillus ryukyuensis]
MKHKAFKGAVMLISGVTLLYHGYHLLSLWSDIPSQVALHVSDDELEDLGPKFLLFLMPASSIFLWLLLGFFGRKPESWNYINLTEENKHIQYAKAKNVMFILQYVGATSLIVANEALLRNAVGMDTVLPNVIAITLIVICFIAPIYQLVWATTLRE